MPAALASELSARDANPGVAPPRLGAGLCGPFGRAALPSASARRVSEHSEGGGEGGEARVVEEREEVKEEVKVAVRWR